MKLCLVSLLSAAAVSVFASSAVAQTPFDGLYQPTGYNWSCNPNYLGSDGGAVGIVDGYFYGVENYCKLTSPRSNSAGSRITYTAICSAEGTDYVEEITLAKTDAGLDLTYDGYTVSWSKCR